VVPNNLPEMQLVFGHVKNVILKLLEQRMTSKFNVQITIDAKEKTKAIFDSISVDNLFYPENPTKTSMSLNDKIHILIESSHIAHLRANLNSTLRLINASYDSIESVKI
jgi:KEOPS complex subunit Pcc1